MLCCTTTKRAGLYILVQSIRQQYPSTHCSIVFNTLVVFDRRRHDDHWSVGHQIERRRGVSHVAVQYICSPTIATNVPSHISPCTTAFILIFPCGTQLEQMVITCYPVRCMPTRRGMTARALLGVPCSEEFHVATVLRNRVTHDASMQAMPCAKDAMHRIRSERHMPEVSPRKGCWLYNPRH